jgi:hypothetical protein
MNKTSRMLLAGLMAAGIVANAGAQMRVQGTRPVDPRLRNQPVAPVDSPPAAQTTLPRQAPVVASGPTAAPTVATPVRTKVAGGPLQRPSYLQPSDTGGPSSGPSSLDLMKQCFDGSVSGSIVNAPCVGYLAGFVGAVRISGSASKDFPICLPEAGLTNEAIVADVSSYLEENPDSLQKSARSVVFLVLSKAYPCDKA